MPSPHDTRDIPSEAPSELLAALVRSDPTRPRLTWYDDQPGSTEGERIELSGRVLANWTAKAANLLQEELDVGPGSVVALDLPPHWRAAYWLFATWSVGAEALVGGPGRPADVTVTADPARVQGPEGGALVAVTLAALARAWTGPPLPPGAIDEAKELATYGDRFEPWAAPAPGDPALTTNQRVHSYADVVPAARAAAADEGLGDQARVMTGAGPADAIRAWLSAWVVDGSVVLVRPVTDGLDDRAQRRVAAERVTDRL